MTHNLSHLWHAAEFELDKCIASSVSRYARNIYHPSIFQRSNVLQRSQHQGNHSSFMHAHFSQAHCNIVNFLTPVTASHSTNAFASHHFSWMPNNCNNDLPSDPVIRASKCSTAGHAHSNLQRPQHDTVDYYFSQIRIDCMLLFSAMINSHLRLNKNDAHTIYPQHSPKLQVGDVTVASCASGNSQLDIDIAEWQRAVNHQPGFRSGNS